MTNGNRCEIVPRDKDRVALIQKEWHHAQSSLDKEGNYSEAELSKIFEKARA